MYNQSTKPPPRRRITAALQHRSTAQHRTADNE
jgi:hypothetical protein